MNIDGQSALVVGGASGLGKAVAEFLAREGAKVAILDRNEQQAVEIARTIGGTAVGADITSSPQLQAALDQVAATQGAPRAVVICAGVSDTGRVLGRGGPLPLEDFERVISINLLGTFNVIRLLAASMAELDPLEDGERGIFVTVASVAAFEGQIGQAAYAASKGGVAAMTLPIARELSRVGIRVMTVAPGIFGTPMLDALPVEVQAALGASIPFPKRVGRPSEFADLVGTCIRNSFLNGEVIRLDGAVRLAPK